MTPRCASRCTALAALLLSLPAAALQSDRQKPMDIAADRIESSTADGIATLDGNVRITQGTLEVEAAKAVVHQGEDRQVRKAQLTGGPARLQQDLDDGGRMVARARQIDYDLASETVVLTGDVVIDQPHGELRGEKVTYEIATGRMTGTGEGPASRVHLRMYPAPAKADDEG